MMRLSALASVVHGTCPIENRDNNVVGAAAATNVGDKVSADRVFRQLPISCRVGNSGKHHPGHAGGAGVNTVVSECGQHRVHNGAVIEAFSSCDVFARTALGLSRTAPDRAVFDQNRAGCAVAGAAIGFRSHDTQRPQQSGQVLSLALYLDP
jgi:hypothetical protein